MKTTLESFVNAGAAAQAAVDSLIPSRSRARAALEAIGETTIADIRCLTDFDVQALACKARELAALAEFDCGRRDAIGPQTSLL